jgi:hypothetical protein
MLAIWLSVPGGYPRLPDSGVQRPPRVSSIKGLNLQSFRRVQAALDSGWLPKNPALSLAICRAAPSRIGNPPGRNHALRLITRNSREHASKLVLRAPICKAGTQVTLHFV